ncbi:MAG: elongation factor Ts [Chloroflexales bacterium]|nr:elongation factor Ts [Chloroflexales bacterium]
MAVTTEMIKELRERTGAGIKECKDILLQTNGDLDKAIEVLRAKGLEIASKKEGREAKEGLIGIYTHPGTKLVALVELNCETDFVARTDDFMSLAKELALHVAATEPRYLTIDEVPEDAIAESGLTPEKFYEQSVLLAQPYVKDPSRTIQDMVKEGIAKLGENIIVRRFVRYEVGG